MNTEQRPKLWKETGADSTGGREEQISRAGVKCMAVVMLVFAAGMRVQAVRTEAGNRPRARGVLTTSRRLGFDEPDMPAHMGQVRWHLGEERRERRGRDDVG